MRKLSQVDLRGLPPELVMRNSQPPQPVETAGYSKAKAILDMAEQSRADMPSVKTSAAVKGSPATLPQIERLLEKHREESDERAHHKRLAGHALAGAGAGSFVGKTINLARNVARFHPPRTGASKLELALTLLGGAGAAHSARKKKTKVAMGLTPGTQKRDASEVGRHPVTTGVNKGQTTETLIWRRFMGRNKYLPKTASVNTNGLSEIDLSLMKIAGMHQEGEELYRVKSTALTREDTRAAADALFGEQAIEARRKEREMVAKLFLQAPAAQTMAPVLQKEAVSKGFVEQLMKGVSKKYEPSDVLHNRVYNTLGKTFVTEPKGGRTPEERLRRFVKNVPYSYKDSPARQSAHMEAEKLLNARGAARAENLQKGFTNPGKQGTLFFSDKPLAKAPPPKTPGILERLKNYLKFGERQRKALPSPSSSGSPIAIPGEVKSASILEIAPSTVAFFEKNAKAMGITEAQIRYPELLKVAAGRSADTHRASPSIGKPSVTTSADGQMARGPIPTSSTGTGL